MTLEKCCEIIIYVILSDFNFLSRIRGTYTTDSIESDWSVGVDYLDHSTARTVVPVVTPTTGLY